MRHRGGGAIVNVSSTQAYVCRPNNAAYVASKGAINALTRSMALDHAADRIRVNTVCPGLVDTRLVREGLARAAGERTAEELLAERVDAHPLGRALQRPCSTDEVAEVIAFLLSDRASFVTGSAYTIDGALTVQALG
jgi:NAD(P)-dependent dehydrogenase (short-subunit alcohol dehydrogenase family)